jgi:hypothetical protein
VVGEGRPSTYFFFFTPLKKQNVMVWTAPDGIAVPE